MQGSSSPAGSGTGDRSNGKLRLRAYAKIDGADPAHPPADRQSRCIPMVVGITALPGMTEERPPLDLVVVLHIRKDNSLPSNWENLLMEAMDAIVKSLDDTDGLAVIPGQSALITAQKFQFSEIITDDTTTLVEALESAELILHGREREDKKRRAGDIIVISNSKDDTSPLNAWRFRSIHAFGFRDAHNAKTLHGISSCRNCPYAVLDDSLGQITQAFYTAISRITSGAAVAAMPIEVKLMCEQTVVLTAVGTPGVSYYISYDKKAGIIWPSTHLASMTTTNILVYLGDLQRPKDLPQLFKVHVKHGDGNKAVDDKLDVQLVEEGSDGSKEVAAEIVRMKAVKIIASIVTMDDKNDWGQLHVAADNLRQQWRMLESSDCGTEAGAAGLISGLAAQMREMEVRLYNNYYWLEYMLSWHSHQQCQLPLPQPLMENKQSANNPLLQLRILAKLDLVQGTTQKGLPVPVMVRVMAPEAGLAMVERASIDLIVVIDANYGLQEKKKKTQLRLQLLKEANKKKEQHNMAKKMVDESEKRLDRLKKKDQITLKTLKMKDQITQKGQEMKDDQNTQRRQEADQITLKGKEMKDQITQKGKEMKDDQITQKGQEMKDDQINQRRQVADQTTQKRKEMKDQITQKGQEMKDDQITQRKQEADQITQEGKEMKDQITQNGQEMTDDQITQKSKEMKDQIPQKSKEQEIEDQINQKRREMESEITQKRQEMNNVAKEEDKLRVQATELEKDVKKVMENTNKRLDLLGKAMALVKNKLNVNDRLAIIPIKSSLAEPATDLFESETSNKVQQLSMPLTYNKATVQTGESFNALHWRKQPKKTMRLIRDCLHSAPSSCTPIAMSARSQGTASMTAHSPVAGGSTKTLQKALMDATKILDDRQGEEKDRQGFIIVISDSDDDSICMENLSSKHTVHAFGFYGMHNTRAMYHIASSSNGIYNIINDDRNEIAEAFTSCINRMTSTIAVNTKVEIMCSPDVALSTIESGPFRYSICGNKKSSSIFLGTLSAGTVKNFIVYVDNVHEDDHGNFSKCLQVCVRWMHPLDRAEKLLEGQVFVVRDGIDGYEEVMENTAHVEAVQIASNITDPNYSQTTMVADKLSQMCIKCPEFTRSAGYGRLIWLSREMIKIDENKHMAVTNFNYYKNMVADRLAYILSWLSYQRSYCSISVL